MDEGLQSCCSSQGVFVCRRASADLKGSKITAGIKIWGIDAVNASVRNIRLFRAVKSEIIDHFIDFEQNIQLLK